MSKRIVLALLVLGFWQTAAFAQLTPQQTPKKWEFSLFGGWGQLGGEDSFPTLVDGNGSRVVTLDGGSGYVAGVRVTENLKGFFGAEFEYTFADQPLELFNLSPQVPSFEVEQKIHNFSYNGLVYLRNSRSRLRPYGTAGAGVSLYQLSGDTEERGVAAGLDLRNRWKFAFSFGGGVKYLASEKWGVRFDFRDRVTSVPDFGIPRQGGVVAGIETPSFRPDGVFHHLELSVGFVYAFNVP